MGNMFARDSGAGRVVTRDDVVGIFVDNTPSTREADNAWAASIAEDFVQLHKYANEPEVDLNVLKTEDKWIKAAAKVTKMVPMNPSGFVGTTLPRVTHVHPIAKLIWKQYEERSFLFEINLGDGNGCMICLRDKHRVCKINPGMENIDKTPWVKLEGWSSDGINFDQENAPSGGPNLWWIGCEGIMNISQLSAEKLESFKKAMQKHMKQITTMVVEHMADVCNSDTSRTVFKNNGFTDEDINLFVKHMKNQGAMDLLPTMQASDGKGCANTSVPIPHLQTNPGYRRAYLEETDLPQKDLQERKRLAEINTKMMQIFEAEQKKKYTGQMRLPFN